MADTVVELVGVRRSYRFGDSVVNALAGLDLTIERGTFLAIIGRSGSGKSTLLNILGGLDRPSRGEVLIDGRSLQGRRSNELAAYRRETVGFIFQSFNLIPHLTALENVAMPLRLAGELGFFERRRRAKELLEECGLGERMNHRPSELSGGERQRVAIARSLANDPKLLLADEPTGNLDSKTAEEIMDMIVSLHKKGDRTIILVTHDQNSAERYAERLIIMEDGKVKEDRPSRSKKGGGKKQEKTPEPEAAKETETQEPKAASGIPDADALARLESELQRLKDALAAANTGTEDASDTEQAQGDTEETS